MPAALSAAEILHEVLVPPRRAYVALPDLEVIERDGWHQIITPSFTRGGFNEIAHAALDPADADRVIDQTIADYRARDLRFRWTVGPDSAPPDLGARLAARGLVHHEVIGMARATAWEAAPDPDITVERVEHATLPAFTDVMARGWGTDPGPLDGAHRLMLADPAQRHRLYLARHRGIPAATAGAVAFPRSMYLLGGVVLP
ncbi:MAG: hypothetical protein H0T79_09065, partial [Deltaproteobacteria bacterium]|nr:hypothetical protein [Deltaproteobacteria bacterium]